MRSHRHGLMLALALVGATLLLPSPSGASDSIQWKGMGPGGGGNIWAVAVSPVNSNIILIGSDVGGIFRTADGGATWTSVDALAAPGLAVDYATFSILWDPAGSIVYANPGHLFKSVDAGVTWTEKADTNVFFQTMTMDPNNHNTIYAGTTGGEIFKTTSGWESDGFNPAPIFTGLPEIRSLVHHPTTSGKVIACTSAGFYATTNGGTTWPRVLTHSTLPHEDCTGLSVNPGSARLWMTLATHVAAPDANGWIDVDSDQGGVYYSDDWGGHWTDANGNGSDGAEVLLNPGFEAPNDCTNGTSTWPQNWFDSDIFGNPVRASRVCDVFHGASGHSIKLHSTVAANGPNDPGPDGPGDIPTVRSDKYAVTPGQVYRLSAWVKWQNVQPLANHFNIVFGSRVSYYKYNAGTQTYDPLPFPGHTYYWTLPLTNYLGVSQTQNVDWRRYERMIRAPEGATHAVVEFYEQDLVGDTFVDDVSLKPTSALPRPVSYNSQLFLKFHTGQAHPSSSSTVYVVTERPLPPYGYVDSLDMDTSGVWRSTDSGSHWDHITRTNYLDNVQDGSESAPICGNGVCEGRWENCLTCPGDCTIANNTDCCGNGTCASIEDQTNCYADCPQAASPREVFGHQPDAYGIWAIDASRVQSDGTIAFGASTPYISHDSGTTWTNLTADLYPFDPINDPNNINRGTWEARGINDVFVYPVATGPEPRDANQSRVYYGDQDNSLNESFDSGLSFQRENGNWYGLGINGGTPAAIIVDPANADRLYVSIGHCAIANCADPNGSYGGAVYGDFNSTTNHWQWSLLGDLASFPKGDGGADMVRDPSGTFYAASAMKGIYKLTSLMGTWTQGTQTWTPEPDPTNCGPNHWTACRFGRIFREPVSGKLYVASGNPTGILAFGTSSGSGAWESANGTDWTKITPSSIDNTPVTSILPVTANKVFVTTWFAYDGTEGSADTAGVWLGRGGVYRGDKDSLGNWTWRHVLKQPHVSSIVASPTDSSILYAFASQIPGGNDTVGQQAGIYRSIDQGITWSPMPNTGLKNLQQGRLTFSTTASSKVYASTIGNGLFEGTISCANPATEAPTSLATCFDGVDNDCDGTIDHDCDSDSSAQVLTKGTVVNGAFINTRGKPDSDARIQLSEDNSTKKLLQVAWTFTGLTIGTNYNVYVEGYRVSGNDTFTVGYKIKSSAGGSCTGTEPGGYISLFNLPTTGDTDDYQVGAIGAVTASNPTMCIRIVDSGVNDATMDNISVDRLYILPAQDVAAASDYQKIYGTIATGTDWLTTQTSNDLRETITEELDNNGVSRLERIWKFINVPYGTSHQLLVEGQRSTSDSDNFQFAYSTDGFNFTDISQSIISNNAPDVTVTKTFGPAGLGGTIYIRVKDTNTVNGSSLSNVAIDQLLIKTTP